MLQITFSPLRSQRFSAKVTLRWFGSVVSISVNIVLRTRTRAAALAAAAAQAPVVKPSRRRFAGIFASESLAIKPTYLLRNFRICFCWDIMHPC